MAILKLKRGFRSALLAVPLLMAANLAAQERPEKLSVAVLNLKELRGISRPVAEVASEFIRTGLVNTRLFRVVERQKVQTILDEQAFQQSGCTETSCAVRIGRMLAANKIFAGTIARSRGRVVIFFRVVDVVSGKVDFVNTSRANTLDDLEKTAEDLALKISARLSGLEPDEIIVRRRLTWPEMTWRSALLPGWGHLADGQVLHGSAYLTLFLGGAALLAAERNNGTIRIEDAGRRLNTALLLYSLSATSSTLMNSRTLLELNAVDAFLRVGRERADDSNRRGDIRAGMAFIYLASLLHAFFSGVDPEPAMGSVMSDRRWGFGLVPVRDEARLDGVGGTGAPAMRFVFSRVF